jgi:hypothetical protein
MTQRDWKEIGIYTDGDVGQVWRAFSQTITLPKKCGLYGRPVDDLTETRDDDFDVMLFHGRFSAAFRDGFLKVATNNPAIQCYVTTQTTIDGKRVEKVSGLGWTIVRPPPGIL